MLDVMSKLPKFAREHVMIADSSGNAFCNLATDPCQVEVAEVINGEVTINGETRPVPPTQWETGPFWRAKNKRGYSAIKGVAKLAEVSGIHRVPDTQQPPSYVSQASALLSKDKGVPYIYLGVKGPKTSVEGGFQYEQGWDENFDGCIDERDKHPNRWKHYSVLSTTSGGNTINAYFNKNLKDFFPGDNVMTFLGPIDAYNLVSFVQGKAITGETQSRATVFVLDIPHGISTIGANATTARQVTIAATCKTRQWDPVSNQDKCVELNTVTGHNCGCGWSRLFLGKLGAQPSASDPFNWKAFNASTDFLSVVTYPCPPASATTTGPCSANTAKAPKFRSTQGANPRYSSETVSIRMGD